MPLVMLGAVAIICLKMKPHRRVGRARQAVQLRAYHKNGGSQPSGGDYRNTPHWMRDAGYVAFSRAQRMVEPLPEVKKDATRRKPRGFGDPPVKAAHAKAAADLEAARTKLSLLGKENQDTVTLAEDLEAARAKAATQERVSVLQDELTEVQTFDPLGLNKEGIFEMNATELKLGRVSMVALLALAAELELKQPSWDTFPSDASAVPTSGGGIVAFLLFTGALELNSRAKEQSSLDGNHEEIHHIERDAGRLAMTTALGVAVMELLFS